MATKKNISLKRVKDGHIEKFGFEHALNLLRWQNTHNTQCWEICEENWIFENNEIARKPNNRDNQETD